MLIEGTNTIVIPEITPESDSGKITLVITWNVLQPRSLAASHIFLSILDIQVEIAIFSILFMSLLVACMHGTNLMLIAIAPKRFKNTGKVATYSGIMNACTYVGAATSIYIFSSIADWGATIIIWAIIAILASIICFAAIKKWRKFRTEFDKEN